MGIFERRRLQSGVVQHTIELLDKAELHQRLDITHRVLFDTVLEISRQIRDNDIIFDEKDRKKTIKNLEPDLKGLREYYYYFSKRGETDKVWKGIMESSATLANFIEKLIRVCETGNFKEYKWGTRQDIMKSLKESATYAAKQAESAFAKTYAVKLRGANIDMLTKETIKPLITYLNEQIKKAA